MNVAQASQIESCYLCGSIADLTDDHVPPKGFFPKPRPQDMIKVRCCSPCNNSHSADDEAFRVFAASLIDRSPAGDWIWENKVEGSSFKRSPKLKENVLKALVKVPVETAAGIREMDAITIPPERANKFLVRVTKGIIRSFFPDRDYSASTFKVMNLRLCQEAVTYCHENLEYDHRGDRVFRFWRSIGVGKQARGIYAYAFYDACLWCVVVDKPQASRRRRSAKTS